MKRLVIGLLSIGALVFSGCEGEDSRAPSMENRGAGQNRVEQSGAEQISIKQSVAQNAKRRQVRLRNAQRLDEPVSSESVLQSEHPEYERSEYEEGERAEPQQVTSERNTPCTDSKHVTAPFLRSDLAYSIRGVDCVGDLAAAYMIPVDLPSELQPEQVRAPAGVRQCSDSPHSHPYGMRSDLAHHWTGLDCEGDKPGNAFD